MQQGLIWRDEGELKIDYKSAFNCVRWGVLLDAVAVHLPDLLPFVSSSYVSPSWLLFGEFVVVSGSGFSRVTPWNPFFFAWPLLMFWVG